MWGATSIAHVLPQCRALQHLDLGGNWLGDEGASRIASCLCSCSSTLSLVGLTWNNIRIEGLSGFVVARVEDGRMLMLVQMLSDAVRCCQMLARLTSARTRVRTRTHQVFMRSRRRVQMRVLRLS